MSYIEADRRSVAGASQDTCRVQDGYTAWAGPSWLVVSTAAIADNWVVTTGYVSRRHRIVAHALNRCFDAQKCVCVNGKAVKCLEPRAFSHPRRMPLHIAYQLNRPKPKQNTGR